MEFDGLSDFQGGSRYCSGPIFFGQNRLSTHEKVDILQYTKML